MIIIIYYDRNGNKKNVIHSFFMKINLKQQKILYIFQSFDS